MRRLSHSVGAWHAITTFKISLTRKILLLSLVILVGMSVVFVTRRTELTWQGEWIAFSCSDDAFSKQIHRIYAIRPDGTELRVLLDTTFSANSPKWSPDAKSLALIVGDTLNIMDVITFNLHPLTSKTTSTAFDRYPTWSPSGKQIAFVSNRHERTKSDIYVIELETGEFHQITDVGNIFGAIDWSSDDWIVFATQPNRLFRVRPDGSELEQLAVYNRWIAHPVWSDDSSSILFQRVERSPDWGAYQFELSSAKTQKINIPARVQWPQFLNDKAIISATGKEIYSRTQWRES